MKTVKILKTFEGYPQGRKSRKEGAAEKSAKVLYVEKAVVEVPGAFAEMIVGKQLAALVDGAPAKKEAAK